MGLDYRYLLLFEHEARFDALEGLAELGASNGEAATLLVLPERTVPLPFPAVRAETNRLTPDDNSPYWLFDTALWFPPDEAIEDYLAWRGTGTADAHYDDQGRAEIASISLTVDNNPQVWTTGCAGDLVLFEFLSTGTTMSMLFTNSGSIRTSFSGLLQAHRGVCGVLDMEEYANVFWLRGEAVDAWLPTASLPLTEIERLVTSPEPLPFSYAAEQVVDTARHLRRAVGGSRLGVHHWLLALLESEELPVPSRSPDRASAARELRARLAAGDTGPALEEDDLRARATRHGRDYGKSLVSVFDVAAAIADVQEEAS